MERTRYIPEQVNRKIKNAQLLITHHAGPVNSPFPLRIVMYVIDLRFGHTQCKTDGVKSYPISIALQERYSCRQRSMAT